METEFDILLKLILDPQSSANATKEGKEFLTVFSAIEKKAKDIEKEAKKFGIPLSKSFKEMTKEGKSALAALGQLRVEFDKGTRTSEKYLLTQVKIAMQAEETARAIQTLKRRQEELQQSGAVASRVGSRLGSFGNQASITGIAITAGILAEATAYARKMEDATEETAAFNNELEKIARARGRIDAVLVRELLPLLQQATKVANLTAQVIENNPELADFAIKGGLVLVALGALSKVASTGFKIYADATFFTAQALGVKAAEMQLLASNNQLKAAGASVGGVPGSKGGNLLGQLGLVAIGVVLAKLATDVVNQVLDATGGSTAIAGAQQRIVEQSDRPYPGIITSARDADNGLQGLINRIKALGKTSEETAQKAEQASTQLSGHENEDQIVDAFINMREQEQQIEENFQEQRIDIINQANQSILNAYQNYASAVADINQQADENRQNIIENFNQANAEAEQRYHEERARMIRDANEELQRIEEDRLQSLRDAEEVHQDKNNDLIANRDALGLALEKERFEKEKANINEQAAIETARRREDLATRLRDFDENFARERAQRQANFEQQLAENEERRQEQLKREREEYEEERKRIAEQKAQKLKELDEQYAEERRRAREHFLNIIRDLDANLLNERERRRDYYALMLADADQFLQDYRASLPSSSNTGYGGSSVGSGMTPSYAEGGYTPGGLIKSHPNEFIASPSTTRALESMIGSKLSQEALLRSVGGGGGMMWNDHRKFSGEYTASMRRAVRHDTLRAMKEIFS